MEDGVRDRVRGVMLGAAAGDALGAGYEFGAPRREIDVLSAHVFGYGKSDQDDNPTEVLVIVDDEGDQWEFVDVVGD